MVPRIEDQYSEKKPTLKIHMNETPDRQNVTDYSPDGYHDDPLMQPRGINLFNDHLNNSKFMDKQPTMDEQCRKDLPLATSDSRKQTSPFKSVRFTDEPYQYL
jgi:hypothetical protein